MNQRAIEKTELNKILSLAADYAVLEGGKERLKNLAPSANPKEVARRLTATEECVTLLFTHGISKIELFPAFLDELGRAKKGSALTCGELLKAEN